MKLSIRTTFIFLEMITCILLLITGCRDDSGNGNRIFDSILEPSPTRSFALAATPYRLQVTSDNAYSSFDMSGLQSHLDIVSLHMDNFFGLPWDEFASQAPLPEPWLQVMAQIKSDAAALGVGIYLSLTPISGTRIQLAARAVDRNGELRVDEDWAVGCYNFDSGPNSDQIRISYLNYVRWMTDYFNPDFLTHGIEINLYEEACPDEFDSLIDLLNQAYDQEKDINPSMPVFPTLTANELWYHSDRYDCFPSDRTCLVENLAGLSLLKRDRLGISDYPIWLFKHFDPWPTEHFLALAEESGEGIVFAETGWNTYPVTIPWPTPEDQCQTVINSSEIIQSRYMEFLFEIADQINSDLVVWWSFRDFLVEEILVSCPCQGPGLWCIVYDSIEDRGLLASWLMWGSMGLLDYDGTAKSTLNTWKQWQRRTIRER